MSRQSSRPPGHYNGMTTPAAPGRAAPALPDDTTLVDALQAGDVDMFAIVVDHYHRSLLRVATTWVRSVEAAEEAVQDTWLAVLTGLPRFERRSSFKTWLFRILANRARTRAVWDGRLVHVRGLPPLRRAAPAGTATGCRRAPRPGARRAARPGP
jgi:RNA polymerase sigma-70 factor, ECF subfamily